VDGVGSAATVLVVLRGNSGSGKSTVARKLRDRYGVAVISQDVLRREVLGVADRRHNPAVELIDSVTRLALDRGLHAIVEGILRGDIYGNMLRSLAADHRGTTNFFRFDVPFDETLRRHASKTGTDFGEHELRQWWRDNDVLHGCEERVIGAELDPDAILDLIVDAARL
jgi:predicted kinase